MKNPFKMYSFRITFFFSFLLFSMLLILLLGLTSYAITNQEVVKQTIGSRKLLLSEINKQLIVQMQSIEYDSQAISSNPKIVDYLDNTEESYERVLLKSDVLSQLSRLSYIKDGVHSVQLFSRGVVTPEWIGTNGLYNYSIIEKSNWYDQIKDADSCWVGVHNIEVDSYAADEKSVASFARKVLSGSGKEVGILVINMKLSHINKIIASISPNDFRYILDSYSRLITQIDGNGTNTLSYKFYEAQIGNALDHANNDQYAISNGDQKVLLIWNKQVNTNWIVMDVISWDNLTKGSRRIQTVIAIAALVCVVLAVVLAFLMSGQFVLPIRNLIQIMNQVKTGNLSIQIENDFANNEFGILNENFNHMLERIQQLLREVNEQNRKKREAEMKMLQEQINPHFIYNTLDMINWQAIEYGAHNISRMLSLLGKMLRLGLSKGAAIITVKSEMEYLQCYIELQKIRFQDRIQFSIDVPEAIYPYLIPKLMLQPFIENSLIHGIDMGKEGLIEVIAIETGTYIEFTIIDNGKGMDVGKLYSHEKMNGTGIYNVQERIRLYGGIYSVSFKSIFDQGTTVRIRIPKETTHNTREVN